MPSTVPGTSSVVVKDAHYHAIKATTTWADFVAGMQELATNSPAARARADARRADATTYTRGTLGGH